MVEIKGNQAKTKKSGSSSNFETLTETPKPHSKPDEEVKEEVEKQPEPKIAETETSKVYILNPEPLAKLKEGDKVMFVERINNRFVLKTKECVDKSKELVAYIRELDKSGNLFLCTLYFQSKTENVFVNFHYLLLQ